MPVLNSTHHNIKNLIKRALKIFKRYGLTEKKMQENLLLFLEILEHKNIVPTFPIPATVLNRKHALIKQLSQNGAAFAIHGKKHIDCTKISPDRFNNHVRKAVQIFQHHKIPCTGFRFPYLKGNQIHLDQLKACSIQWDSSDAILWDVIPRYAFDDSHWDDYQNMLRHYNPKNSSHALSLPRFHNGLLEIPISLPDDDLLERLGIRDSDEASGIWLKILRNTHSRGELFTLQLHPERITLYKNVLEMTIQSLTELNPAVWITTLSGIHDWWKLKSEFSVNLTSKNNYDYDIEVICDKQATFLVRSEDLPREKFYKDYKIENDRNFRLVSRKRPLIGISPGCSPRLTAFLADEGFIFEKSENLDAYSIYLDNFSNFSEEDELKVLREIDNNTSPLIRFWRWPNNHKSCFSITGDIDSLTLFDFLVR